MSDQPKPALDVYKFIKEAQLEDKKVESEIDPRDKSFMLLAQTDMWPVLKEYIQSRINGLRSLLGYSTEGKTLDDIGMRFLVADLASAELENLIEKVESARKSAEELERKDPAAV